MFSMPTCPRCKQEFNHSSYFKINGKDFSAFCSPCQQQGWKKEVKVMFFFAVYMICLGIPFLVMGIFAVGASLNVWGVVLIYFISGIFFFLSIPCIYTLVTFYKMRP